MLDFEEFKLSSKTTSALPFKIRPEIFGFLWWSHDIEIGCFLKPCFTERAAGVGAVVLGFVVKGWGHIFRHFLTEISSIAQTEVIRHAIIWKQQFICRIEWIKLGFDGINAWSSRRSIEHRIDLWHIRA